MFIKYQAFYPIRSQNKVYSTKQRYWNIIFFFLLYTVQFVIFDLVIRFLVYYNFGKINAY